jgi:hypothetical protein
VKRNRNKLVLRFSIAILLALSATNFASALGQTRETTKRRLTALVLSVDQKNRTMLVREFGGHTVIVAVPKGFELSLSQNSPTMGRTHLVGLEWAVPGMVIDVYVQTNPKVAETASAAANR